MQNFTVSFIKYIVCIDDGATDAATKAARRVQSRESLRGSLAFHGDRENPNAAWQVDAVRYSLVLWMLLSVLLVRIWARVWGCQKQQRRCRNRPQCLNTHSTSSTKSLQPRPPGSESDKVLEVWG